MIYITGDTHGEFKHRFNTENFPEQKEMSKDDYVLICGDFGGVWDVGWESKHEKYWLDWFEERSYTLLFIDGNHENFDRLNGYPVKMWHGGKVHELRPHVKDGEHQISLCHFPIVEWNAYFHGSYHIYGHIHNRKDEAYEVMKKKDHALNAGCMINNYAPASFNELVRNNEAFKKNNIGGRSEN